MEKNVFSLQMIGMQGLCQCMLSIGFTSFVFECFVSQISFGFVFCIRLLAAKYRPQGIYKDARSIVVIHNLKHQV